MSPEDGTVWSWIILILYIQTILVTDGIENNRERKVVVKSYTDIASIIKSSEDVKVSPLGDVCITATTA